MMNIAKQSAEEKSKSLSGQISHTEAALKADLELWERKEYETLLESLEGELGQHKKHMALCESEGLYS